MNPFSLMKKDHTVVKDLFKTLERARVENRKDTLFEELRNELDAHAYMEEKAFYPELEESKETHDLTLEAIKEHDAVKALLKELGDMDKNGEEWKAKLTILKENVEHHVEEEEKELFPKARKILKGRENEISTNMQDKKQEFLDKSTK